jgi:hypothetical protein
LSVLRADGVLTQHGRILSLLLGHFTHRRGWRHGLVWHHESGLVG